MGHSSRDGRKGSSWQTDVVNLGHILTDPKPKDNSELLPSQETRNKQVRHVIIRTFTNELFDVYY